MVDVFASYARTDKALVPPLVAARRGSRRRLLEPYFAQVAQEFLGWAKSDPDLDVVREHPRYKAMVAAAEAKLGGK